ncbi:MAG: ZIP Zinc transporter [Candidatus Lokiarchaeum sp. GC14_75]|nr:MAG: ZIP Zinc transporter [Candidatus Lokiarchaeum sp. GC14_75]
MIDLTILVILIIAVIMGVTDFIGHRISGFAAGHRDSVLSFSAGLLISLLFLILVPDVTSRGFSELLFLFMLVGFLLMHLAEKYIYKHILDKQELLEDLKVVHIIGFGLDNFLVGFIIASLVELDFFLVINLSVPLFIQMLTSSISLGSIDTRLKEKYSKFILSVLPILGAILGIVLEYEHLVTNYVLAFVLGILFYMIVRDVLPQGRRGSSVLFISGNLITISLWLIRILF